MFVIAITTADFSINIGFAVQPGAGPDPVKEATHHESLSLYLKICVRLSRPCVRTMLLLEQPSTSSGADKYSQVATNRCETPRDIPGKQLRPRYLRSWVGPRIMPCQDDLIMNE